MKILGKSEQLKKKKITLTFTVEEKSGRRLQSDEGLVESVKRKYYDYIYEDGCSNCLVIVDTCDSGVVNNNSKRKKGKRKKGKWIMDWHYFFHREVPVCSQCLQAAAYKFDVCPNCGADMREDVVQKKGKWIWHDVKDGYLISAYSCSVCNFFSSTNRPNICPGCGADMREEKTDDQSNDN